VLAGTARALTRLPGALRKRRRKVAGAIAAGNGEQLADAWAQVSVIIITRDAAEVLPAALACIPSAAEVVVSDGGSHDDTVGIARFAGARLVPQDPAAVAAAGGNFDIARNAAAAATQRQWVMFLDADERIPKSLADEIAQAIAADEYDAYDMPRINLFWGKPVRLLGDDRQLRLVRRGHGRFEGRTLHRRLQVDGRVGHLSASLLHDNVRDWRDIVRRFQRDVPVQAAAEPMPALAEVLRTPVRMFRYYYVSNGAWRDGLRGFAASAAYACYHGAIAAAARGRRRG